MQKFSREYDVFIYFPLMYRIQHKHTFNFPTEYTIATGSYKCEYKLVWQSESAQLKQAGSYEQPLIGSLLLACNQSLGMWQTMLATHTSWIQQWNYNIFFCVVPSKWWP